MKEKVLLVDDDASLTTVVEMALEKEGFHVDVAHSGREGLQQLYQGHPDLVILDVMMPVMDGWETCQRIRELSDVPILMLSAKDGDANELRGLKVGADQYTTKPLAIPVLIARVEALLRRSRASTPPSRKKEVVVGELRVNFATHQATLSGNPLDLSPTEFRLLSSLASRAGEVVPRAELLTEVWGREYRGEDLYLKLYICYLRQKIEADPGNPRYIITRRGIGYYLNDEPLSHGMKTMVANPN